VSVGLIDYGSGNLRSVAKALEKAGATVLLVSKVPFPEQLDAIALPGVGSFGDSVRQLHERNLFGPVQQWLRDQRPFLGICLGYQLLFESSEESPGVEGLAIFAGHVRRFRTGDLKVPQIGWNRIRWTAEARNRLPGLPKDPFVYFVHSYFPVPADSKMVAATADYGETFAAAVVGNRLLATQFHPEKSQENGLAILREFVSSLA
jgi:imidazole glycerol-phosphate synthase subunit HisH